NTNTRTHELTITVQGLNWEDLKQGAFYEGEVQVRDLRQLIGQELTAQLLRSKDVEVPTLHWEGQTYYRKAATPGHYQTLYGEVDLSRHCYQTSAGGATLCPWAVHGQVRFGSATPLLAEVVSFKLASQTASEVAQDLDKSHGVALSATYLHHLAQQVGRRAGGQTGGLAPASRDGARLGGSPRHRGGWNNTAGGQRGVQGSYVRYHRALRSGWGAGAHRVPGHHARSGQGDLRAAVYHARRPGHS